MPGLVNTAPSLLSLAVSHKQVPFVLSSSQHSIVAASVAAKAKSRRRCQSATGELLHSMPKKCQAFLAFVKEVLPAAAQDSDEEEASSSPPPPPPPLSPFSQANGGYCLSPSRSKSVSGELSTASPSPSHPPRNPDQRQQHQRAKLALRSMSEPEARVNTISSINIDSTFFSSPCADECDVLRAYREALWFHASLQDEYDSTMRLFILHRYGRLRSLIRKATLDQQLRALREGLQCKCSCRSVRRGRGKGTGAGRAASVDEAGSRLDELMSAVKPTLDRVTSYFKTAFAQIVPSLLVRSSPSLTTSLSSSPNDDSATVGEHGWQRSRLVLLERHLGKLKRENLNLRATLPLTRYRAMKSSLKHVLDARMV